MPKTRETCSTVSIAGSPAIRSATRCTSCSGRGQRRRRVAEKPLQRRHYRPPVGGGREILKPRLVGARKGLGQAHGAVGQRGDGPPDERVKPSRPELQAEHAATARQGRREQAGDDAHHVGAAGFHDDLDTRVRQHVLNEGIARRQVPAEHPPDRHERRQLGRGMQVGSMDSLRERGRIEQGPPRPARAADRGGRARVAFLQYRHRPSL